MDLDSVAAELRSTAPVEVPPDAGYAIARGAAQTAEDSGYPAGAATQMAPAADATMMAPASDATMMAPAAGDATQMAPTAGDATVGPQLAYAQEEPGDYELPLDSLDEFVPPPRLRRQRRRRRLLRRRHRPQRPRRFRRRRRRSRP